MKALQRDVMIILNPINENQQAWDNKLPQLTGRWILLFNRRKLFDEILSADVRLKEYQHTIFAVPYPYLYWPAVKWKRKLIIMWQHRTVIIKERRLYRWRGLQRCSFHECQLLCRRAQWEKSIMQNQFPTGRKSDQLPGIFYHTPIFCCGEPLAMQEAGFTNDFASPLQLSLFHLPAEKIKP